MSSLCHRFSFFFFPACSLLTHTALVRSPPLAPLCPNTMGTLTERRRARTHRASPLRGMAAACRGLPLEERQRESSPDSTGARSVCESVSPAIACIHIHFSHTSIFIYQGATPSSYQCHERMIMFLFWWNIILFNFKFNYQCFYISPNITVH